MANRVGTFTINGNYNVKRARPLDARMLVDTLEDLLSTNWKFTYNGMLTVVASDPITDNNGVYRLINRFKPLLKDSWVKLLNSGDIVKDLNGLIYVTASTYEYWKQINPNIEIGDVIGIEGLNSNWSFDLGETSAKFKLLTDVTQKEGYVTVQSRDIGIYNITIDQSGNLVTISSFDSIDKLVTERALRADLLLRLKPKIDDIYVEGDVDLLNQPIPLPHTILDRYIKDPTSYKVDDPNRFEVLVQIPLALLNRSGLAKSSLEENQISFENGEATVNALNVNKLSQTPGDTLIIDNGDSILNNYLDSKTDYYGGGHLPGALWPNTNKK